jgi:hypothetical protein
MKKIALFIMITIISLSSCTNEELTDSALNQTESKDEYKPVVFGTYIEKAVLSRAVNNSTTTLSAKNGFGVFAFNTYESDIKTISPNFMYNQKVASTNKGDSWNYSPVKYWPTNSSSTENKNSFFAYAPYIDSNVNTEGITSITSNSSLGAPKLTFTNSSNVENTIDLLWAVSKKSGKALKDMTSLDSNGEVNFNFRHALARLSLNIQGAFASNSNENIADGNKITVESITISGSFPSNGILDLDNEIAYTPQWENTNGETVFNISNKQITESIRDGGDSKSTDSIAGVTNTNTNLLANTSDGKEYYLTFIPSKGDLTVSITYWLTTKDSNLAEGYFRVKSNAKKTISNMTLEAGKNYGINILVGMTGIQFDSNVTEWETIIAE